MGILGGIKGLLSFAGQVAARKQIQGLQEQTNKLQDQLSRSQERLRDSYDKYNTLSVEHTKLQKKMLEERLAYKVALAHAQSKHTSNQSKLAYDVAPVQKQLPPTEGRQRMLP